MQATKIGAVSALLIATLAVAFVPTAAADGVDDCTDESPVPGPGPDDDAVDCIGAHMDDCDTQFPGLTNLEKYECILLG